MESRGENLKDIAAILERLERKLFGPDTIKRIDEFLEAASGDGNGASGPASEAIVAAFEALVLSQRGDPEAAREGARLFATAFGALAWSTDVHTTNIHSIIAAVTPVRPLQENSKWQPGRVVSLGSGDESSDRTEDASFLVVHSPAVFLPGRPGQPGTGITAKKKKAVLEVEIPTTLDHSEPGTLVHLLPWGGQSDPLSQEKRRLLRDRLVSVRWRALEKGETFLPVEIAPLRFAGGQGRGELAELYRATIPVPATLLDRAKGSLIRFSLDWPYEETPTFEMNPVLLRCLPVYPIKLVTTSSEDGAAVVQLPTPSISPSHVARKVMGVSVRQRGGVGPFRACCWPDEGGSGPVWHSDPYEESISIQGLEGSGEYEIEVVVAKYGNAPLAPRHLWRHTDESVVSVVHSYPSLNLAAHPAVLDDTDLSTSVVSLGLLKRFIEELNPFGSTLSLDPETLSAKRMLEPTDNGLAMALHLNIEARAEQVHPEDRRLCAVMIRTLLDRLMPMPMTSFVTIGGAVNSFTETS